MSDAYSGGSEVYSDVSYPTDSTAVLDILERFIADNFKHKEDVATEVVSDDENYIIIFAKDDENTSPATLGNREADLIAYGSIAYTARDHDVQNIWENQFEIRQTSNSRIYVRFSDWFGTTVSAWEEKVADEKLYL